MREVLKGMEDIICYDDFWLNKDMENMGYIFEYCEKYCRKLFNITYRIDIEKFITKFMNSDCRALMEIGHPTLISQAAETTVQKFVEVDNNGHIEKFKLSGRPKRYKSMQLYWIGWIYAYIHFESKKPSEEIINKLPFAEMLIDYKCGHEMSKEAYYRKIKYLFES